MEKLTRRGQRHVSEMMDRFKKGKLLRTSYGAKLDPHSPKDVDQALAIFYSEARRGEEKGFGKRTYQGSRRTRPNLAKR
jgi:hypothetical protein